MEFDKFVIDNLGLDKFEFDKIGLHDENQTSSANRKFEINSSELHRK